ncbi:MAG: F0F1 ATP synthase subunit delta, partial [Cetobacterium sp.]
NVDKTLIGGGIIKIGDEITDGSIRRQLETLTQK